LLARMDVSKKHHPNIEPEHRPRYPTNQELAGEAPGRRVNGAGPKSTARAGSTWRSYLASRAVGPPACSTWSGKAVKRYKTVPGVRQPAGDSIRLVLVAEVLVHRRVSLVADILTTVADRLSLRLPSETAKTSSIRASSRCGSCGRKWACSACVCGCTR